MSWIFCIFFGCNAKYILKKYKWSSNPVFDNWLLLKVLMINKFSLRHNLKNLIVLLQILAAIFHILFGVSSAFYSFQIYADNLVLFLYLSSGSSSRALFYLSIKEKGNVPASLRFCIVYWKYWNCLMNVLSVLFIL